MSFTICTCCGSRYEWSWEEAFDKFGFQDGDGIVMTEAVADVLRRACCTLNVHPWGFHNVVITGIARGGESIIPAGTKLGYDNPRDYLPPDIVELLDRVFPNGAEVQP